LLRAAAVRSSGYRRVLGATKDWRWAKGWKGEEVVPPRRTAGKTACQKEDEEGITRRGTRKRVIADNHNRS
jgi:hypothetical protein